MLSKGQDPGQHLRPSQPARELEERQPAQDQGQHAQALVRRIAAGGPPALRPQEVLALQRASGNRAAQRALAPAQRLQRRPASARRVLPIQRYKDLTAGFTLPDAETQRRDQMFSSHAIDPVVEDMATGGDWKHKSNTVDPDLISSDDETIVMQKEAKEPQEFYATGPVIDQAKRALADHNSLIALESGGASLDVGETTLQRVKAKSRMIDIAERDGRQIESLMQHICINKANLVLGLGATNDSHKVISQGTTQRPDEARGLNITTDNVASDQVIGLAEQVGAAREGTTQESMLEGAKPGSKKESTGESYGRAIAGGTADPAAKRLGINQYAVPKVGEGMATYSIATRSEDLKKDFSVLVEDNPTVREFIWGYHYAGVVAESEDGADKITLENYNRKSDIVKAHFDKIKADFGADATRELEEAGKAGDEAAVKKLYAKLVGDAGRDASAAAEQIKQSFIKSNQAALQAWFFHMYGTTPGSGQTFHEQMAASGYFANPLTVRVGARDGTSYKGNNIHARLTSPIYNMRSDYSNKGHTVRTNEARNVKAEVAAKAIVAKADPDEARAELKAQMRLLRADQMKVHFDYAKQKALDLRVRAPVLPAAQPGDKAGMQDAMAKIALETTNKRGRLASVKKERRKNLADFAAVATEMRGKVGELWDYYTPFV